VRSSRFTVAVTVCRPYLAAVQVAPVQEPSGRIRWLVLAALKRIEKVDWAVTSPREWPAAS
jgi:hypothetical protein